MRARHLQFFSGALFVALTIPAAAAELHVGSSHRIRLRDISGQEHATAAGTVVIVTVVTRQTLKKAGQVANTLPDRCLGDPNYRYIAIVNFQRQIAAPLQGFVRAIIRRKLVTEVNKLQKKYSARGITRDPRRDVLLVPDFDGGAVTQLGLTPQSGGVAVFVFNRQGRLVARWNDVPGAEAMAGAIAAAE